jgi:AcrR family transcriptional regulator
MRSTLLPERQISYIMIRLESRTTATMKRIRTSGDRRRSLILKAAAAVFADHGFKGATTKQIAEAAGVSEALLYQHFPSKRALHAAVLRRAIADQDTVHELLGHVHPSSAGLVRMLSEYLGYCLFADRASVMAQGHRFLLTSLAGNGDYARLVYRRALRLNLKGHTAAIEAARAAGDTRDRVLDVRNSLWLMEHVGSGLLSMQLAGIAPAIYQGDKMELLKQAVFFVARGLGMSDEAIERYYVPPDASKWKAARAREEAALSSAPAKAVPRRRKSETLESVL